jgi:hypothetical protein
MGTKIRIRIRMNSLDHISECLVAIFWVKIVKFLDADPGSGMEKIGIQIRDQGFGIWDKHPGSATPVLKILTNKKRGRLKVGIIR